MSEAATDLAEAWRRYHDGWFERVAEVLDRIPASDPLHPRARALGLLARHVLGDDVAREAAELSQGPDPEAARWGWWLVARRNLSDHGTAAAIEALETLTDGPTWRARVAALAAEAELRRGNEDACLAAVAASLGAAREVADPADRGDLLRAAMTVGYRFWGAEERRTVGREARAAFAAAGLPYGTASLANTPLDEAEVDPAVRVLQVRGRTDDVYAALHSRGSRLHQAGEHEAAARAYDASAAWADVLRPATWAPVRAVLDLQLGRVDDARARVEEARAGLRPAPRLERAVRLVEAALSPQDAGTRALAALLTPGAAPGTLDAFAAGAAADRLEGAAPDGTIARLRAFALQGWGAADPAGRARVAAHQRRAIRGGGPVPCGGFDLLRRIGAGATGEVWEARWAHAEGLGAFALKFVSAARAADLRARAALEQEVRAVAALSHPHVVPILDVGVAPDEDQTGGALPAGAPWFAMPLARGSLRAHPPLAWEDLRRALAATLRALAHTHARGLLHLDVKPENLLVPDPLDPAAIWLADFGQAAAVGTAGSGGTPAYMAPEQLAARGGLTAAADLYAVGAVGWDLATGDPPFGFGPLPVVTRGHRAEDPPPFVPRSPAPPELQDWLRWLLAKRPADRPASAAAAAEALAAIPERRRRAILPVPERRPPDPEPRGVAPSPALLHRRSAAFVGRGPERDRLWGLLHRAVEHGRAELVLVRGPAGSGVRRLATWLGQAAAEAGVARCVTTAPRDVETPVVWLADATTSARAVGEVLAGAGPALVVVALPDPIPAEEVARWEVLDPEDLRLGPLPDEELDRAVASLAPLRPTTRARLVAAAAGLPGRAVALLRRASDRHDLRLTPTGWALPDDWRPAEETGPDPAALAPAARDALELAVVLGEPIDPDAWAASALAAGLADPAAVVVGLCDAGWLVRDATGLRFPGPEVRARVARLAGPRAARWHRACAAALHGRSGAGDHHLARHLLGAGDAAAALALLRAAPARVPPDLAEAVVRAVQAPEGSDDWYWALHQRASALDAVQGYAELREGAARADATARKTGHPVPVPLEILAARAEVATGAAEAGLERFERAVAGAERAGRWVAAARYEAGVTAEQLGHTDRALAHFRRAVAAAGPDEALVAGYALGRLGEAARAEAAFRSALAHPDARVVAAARSHLATLLRDRGRLDEALDHAHAAVAGAPNRPVRALYATNLATVLLLRGALEDVVAWLPRCRAGRGTRTDPHQRAVVAVLSLLSPHDGSWEARWAAVEAELPARVGAELLTVANAVAGSGAVPAEIAARLWAIGVDEGATDTLGGETMDLTWDPD